MTMISKNLQQFMVKQAAPAASTQSARRSAARLSDPDGWYAQFKAKQKQENSKRDAQRRMYLHRQKQRAQEEQGLPPIKTVDPAPMKPGTLGAGTNWQGIRRFNNYLVAPSTMNTKFKGDEYVGSRIAEDGYTIVGKGDEYTRVQPWKPVVGHTSIGDPHFEDAGFDAGKDPGGNRIFQDPHTGLEHYYPEGRQAPLFHHENRKNMNRKRMEKDVEAAGKLRIGDIFKNLWYPGK